NGTLIFGLDEFAYVFALQGIDQFLDGRVVLVVSASGYAVGVGRILVFDEQGVCDWVQASLQCTAGVDQRAVDVGKYAGQGGGFKLLEFQVLGVVYNIPRGGQQVAWVIQFDQALLLDQQQGTSAVGRVVGNGDEGAVLEFVDAVDLVGVGAKRFDMDRTDVDQVRAMLFVEGVHVRHVLEKVSVNVAFGDLDVGLHVVGEDFDVEVDALFF